MKKLGLIAACGVALVAGALLWWYKPAPLFGPKVPVIIYLSDTLRADRLGLYGNELDVSPVIDALAGESVVFDQAYAAGTWTVPSIASLATSKFPCEHGVTSPRKMLSPDIETLAQRLQSLGYTTESQYQNLYAGPVSGLDRGFDRQTDLSARGAYELIENVGNVIRDISSGPFYLYLHTMEPHDPFGTPANYTVPMFDYVSIDKRVRIRKDSLERQHLAVVDWSEGKPLGTTQNTAAQKAAVEVLNRHADSYQDLYNSSVLYVDGNVGTVIDELKQQGVWDRAIFVFLSDHGEELGDRGDWFHGQSAYNELVHVPLIIRFPNGEHGGKRISTPVSLVDVMPTLLDYLGAGDLCEGCRGSSLLRLLDGSTADDSSAVAVYSMRTNERQYFRPWREERGDLNIVVHKDDWKGIWNADLENLELYDLRTDYAEKNDLSGAQPELSREMIATAQDWLVACEAAGQAPQETSELDEDTKKKLRALGYIN